MIGLAAPLVDPGHLTERIRDLESQGMTVVVVHRDGTVAGAIGVRDEPAPRFPVIKTLAGHGIGVTMLTGDNERTARSQRVPASVTCAPNYVPKASPPPWASSACAGPPR